MVPEPNPYPNQRAGLGSDDGSNARQPRTRESWQECDQHLHEQGEPAVPATDPARRARVQETVGRPFDPFAREYGKVQPNQPRRPGPSHVPRPCVERRFPLVQRQVAIRADVRGQQAIVATATRAVKDQDRLERAVEVATRPAIRRHPSVAAGTRNPRDRHPAGRVGFASKSGDG